MDALPAKTIARVVFDAGKSPGDYIGAINALQPHSYLVGELLDSQDVKRYTPAEYSKRTRDFVNTFVNQIDLWEIGNEINGEWLGSTTDVISKVTDAYNQVTAAGKQSALTLSYNPNCWSSSGNEMFTWAKANVPAALKAGLSYVLVSYYPEDCNDYWPTPVDWQAVFDQLHSMFPQAKLGFGESGNSNDRDSLSQKISLLHKYYRLHIAGDNYVGGYFWWYYVEDALPHRDNPLWQALSADIGQQKPA